MQTRKPPRLSIAGGRGEAGGETRESYVGASQRDRGRKAGGLPPKFWRTGKTVRYEQKDGPKTHAQVRRMGHPVLRFENYNLVLRWDLTH